MKRLLIYLVTAAAAASMGVAACAQAAPSPTPTTGLAAPTRAAEPTKPAAPTAAPAKAAEPIKAPAVQPTAVPARKVDFPEKGKAITIVVPYAPGGGADIGARVLGPLMEKELGGSIQIVNKAGASGQLGLTDVVQSRPDGYTLGYLAIPGIITTYLDPSRKAVYTRKDFQPLGAQYLIPIVVLVQANSPFKSLKDVLDAAKANPEKIKSGTSGLGGVNHLALLLLEKVANVKFATVHFDGGGPEMTALLGGHIDVGFGTQPDGVRYVRSGQMRALAIADKEESPFLPGVKTMEAQGYNVSMLSIGMVTAPAGISGDVLDVLASAMRKAVATDEHKKRMDEMGQTVRYTDPAQTMAAWADMEERMRPLMELAKQ